MGCLAVLLLYLLLERIRLSQRVRRIPLRICVTGTRGKSSVTRLIAGALRENGLKVLAKTTGSKPVLLLPDGAEKEIHRRGNPSILEGKDVLKAAVEHGAQAVVAEMMSIRPESTAVESAHLFRPHVVVITNVRLDHLDQMGSSKEDIAGCFASAIPEEGAVIIPEKEFYPVYREMAERRHSNIVLVPDNAYRHEMETFKIPSPFVRDVQLSLAAAEFMAVDPEGAAEGMRKAMPDFGSLKAWKAVTGPASTRCLFVSAFAANDPESTGSVVDFFLKSGALKGKKLIALLNFRKDRGDRTRQWLGELKRGFLSDFHRIVLLGDHSLFIKGQMIPGVGRPEFLAFHDGDPREISEHVIFPEEECVLVGMGNMAGIGKEFVLYWEQIGEPYAL